MSGRLSSKTAIITGAASGIGRASALLFAREGANLLAFDRADAVHEVAGQINASGGHAVAMTGDAGDEADIKALVARAKSTFGALHVMFANAGITGGVRGGFFDATPEHWAEVLRINLIGPFLAVKHAAPLIEASGGGAIVCTASVAGLRSGAGPAQYSASKAGVINLVQTAAQQLAGTGVRVNAVLPGLTETGMTKPMYDGARAAGKEHKIGQLNPMLRGGKPEEIAAVALFLASNEASYVNGQALAVDGGLSSSHPTSRPPGDPNRPSS
ncbi:SDR family NAD(P)-dependent oxidoreductase [Parerythrobacter lacustris]|uniref:SDR family oxidoreductase n=1 Tax=Parerythrobacter lacustris TaxID=2969984 RepID=A0ABT1XRE1_9SPHN|nr:SDR family NAD(P)-dependent oxidoreductase [Parerythrobacter lacustris]MCR2833506.1 SDR family oxidoreductase [Parerythrobacter lacustris]